MLNLSSDKLELLRGCLRQRRPDLLYVIDSKESVTVNEELGFELRMAILDEFLDAGLKPDSEPNEVGLQLERLSDDIGRMAE